MLLTPPFSIFMIELQMVTLGILFSERDGCNPYDKENPGTSDVTECVWDGI